MIAANHARLILMAQMH